MTKRSQRQVVNDRRAKKEEVGVQEKVFSNVNTCLPLKPMNDKQKDYISAIHHCPVVITIGVWESSKSFIPATIAADWLMDKKIKKVIIDRTAEGKDETVGLLLPGSLNEKCAAPFTDTMKEYMGGSHFQAMLESAKIKLMVLEQMKGRSWDQAEDVEVWLRAGR